MVTLETILQRAARIGLPIAKNEFVNTKQHPAPDPPFICYLTSEKHRGSDDRNRIREYSASLELYTDRKENPELERRIEEEVLFDVEFDKFQESIKDENMVQTAYEFATVEKLRREN